MRWIQCRSLSSSSAVREGARGCHEGGAVGAAGRRGRRKQIGDSRGGRVGQRPKKDQGQIFVCDIFYGVFLTPLTEKRPKT
jgi:hypothetical protein